MNQKCVKCFKSVSEKTRFDILEFIKKAKKGVNVSKLVEFTKLRQPTVTFHINKLAEVGLIEKKRVGREVICSMKTPLCAGCPLK
jgi:DNA-binding transcriptional ArsR family regulator